MNTTDEIKSSLTHEDRVQAAIAKLNYKGIYDVKRWDKVPGEKTGLKWFDHIRCDYRWTWIEN